MYKKSSLPDGVVWGERVQNGGQASGTGDDDAVCRDDAGECDAGAASPGDVAVAPPRPGDATPTWPLPSPGATRDWDVAYRDMLLYAQGYWQSTRGERPGRGRRTHGHTLPTSPGLIQAPASSPQNKKCIKSGFPYIIFYPLKLPTPLIRYISF